MEITSVKKQDINQLWDLHCRKGVYIFNELKPCSHKEDLLNNFYYYFGNRNDYLLKKGGQIAGLYSLNRIMWKNNSCNISCQLCDPGLSDAFIEGLTLFLNYLINDLNLLTVRMTAESSQLQELEQLKVKFHREGTLREHIFRNGQYNDVHIITFSRTEEGGAAE